MKKKRRALEPIETLLNLGPKSSEWLSEIGIHNRGDLEKIGPINAYKALKKIRSEVSLNLLYAMVGALSDISWKEIPLELKEKLKSKIN